MAFKKYVIHQKHNASSSGLASCKFMSTCEHEKGEEPKHVCDWSSQSQFSAKDPSGEKEFYFPTCSVCDKSIRPYSDEQGCRALFENPRTKFF